MIKRKLKNIYAMVIMFSLLLGGATQIKAGDAVVYINMEWLIVHIMYQEFLWITGNEIISNFENSIRS